MHVATYMYTHRIPVSEVCCDVPLPNYINLRSCSVECTRVIPDECTTIFMLDIEVRPS